MLLYTENAKKYPNNELIYSNNLNPLDVQELEELYTMMEGILIDLYRYKILPDSISHLAPQFDNLGKLIEKEKKDKQVSNNIIGLVCKLYLSIFDTLPVYQNTLFTDEEWRIALTAKKLASLVLNYHLIISNTYYKILSRARKYSLMKYIKNI